MTRRDAVAGALAALDDADFVSMKRHCAWIIEDIRDTETGNSSMRLAIAFETLCLRAFPRLHARQPDLVMSARYRRAVEALGDVL